MGLWNLGSAAAQVFNYYDNVPTTISGLPLIQMADRAREYCEQYTGTTIGSNSIDTPYQNPILYRMLSQVAKISTAVGTDASSLKLGDFSTNKNSSSSVDSSAVYYAQLADEELSLLGRSAQNFQLFYG